MSERDKLERLEELLLDLGRLELNLEQSLDALVKKSRAASARGEETSAAAALERHEQVKANLRRVRERIYTLETRLYSARRRRQ